MTTAAKRGPEWWEWALGLLGVVVLAVTGWLARIAMDSQSKTSDALFRETQARIEADSEIRSIVAQQAVTDAKLTAALEATDERGRDNRGDIKALENDVRQILNGR